MTVADFEGSAEAAAPHIAMANAGVGARILGAVRVTLERVGQNTNLGIVLLCVPLAVAREKSSGGDLREAVRKTLDTLTMDDAARVFEAIALANPGGLGNGGEHDVRKPPQIPLLDAMRLAAPHDRIAHQYVSAYSDIFDSTLTVVAGEDDDTALAARIYWYFLTHFPDSHVVRKYGLQRAEALRAEAQALDTSLGGAKNFAVQQKILLDFDARLKACQINPGTSADLTVATLFAHKLQQISE